jgi:hypothetical protein
MKRAIRVSLRRNYTVAERALIAVGAAAGKSAADIDAVLKADAERTGGSFRSVNPTSLGMASRYPSMPAAEAQALWDHITHPKPLGDT